ncbi:MAG: universal stress protein [Bacteroidales bacterium]|nr:universal stress protein [Bacteroidales bacterium]
MANYAISVISSPTLEEGIKGFIRKTTPDMMAVLSQGKGKIKRLIYGSSAEDIIKEANIPVLINKIH